MKWPAGFPPSAVTAPDRYIFPVSPVRGMGWNALSANAKVRIKAIGLRPSEPMASRQSTDEDFHFTCHARIQSQRHQPPNRSG